MAQPSKTDPRRTIGATAGRAFVYPAFALAATSVTMAAMGLLRVAAVCLKTMVPVTARRLVRGSRHPDWNWSLELAVEVLRGRARLALNHPIDWLRAWTPEARLGRALARNVKVEHTTLAGRAALQITPKSWQPEQRTILYLHGGGYVLCSPGTHKELMARLAIACQARCIGLDYRLAPEHPFPAAIDDAHAAYVGLLARGIAAERLVLAGDSCGGGLAMAVMLRLRDEGTALPCSAILLSPWLDLSEREFEGGGAATLDYLEPGLLNRHADLYLQGTSVLDPSASPGLADLAGLPPLLVQVGGVELLRRQCEAFVDRATAAKVPVTLQVGEGMVHAWQAFASIVPQSKEAISAAGLWLGEQATEPPGDDVRAA